MKRPAGPWRWLDRMDREDRQRAFRDDTTLGMVLLWAGPVLIFLMAILRMG